MKRFVKEYANYQLVNSPFLSDICNSLYKHRIISALSLFLKHTLFSFYDNYIAKVKKINRHIE